MSQASQFLVKRWDKLCSHLKTDKETDTIWNWIESAYTEPIRHYHNLDHLASCFHLLDEVHFETNCWTPEIELAIWLHDIVYDPIRSDNEEESVSLAKNALGVLGRSDLSDTVETYILATKKHLSNNPNCQLFLDIDLSILGFPPKTFEAYQEKIRKEYEWVPENTFKTKRLEILQSFLDRPRIFYTDYLFNQLEKQARINLTNAANRFALGST